MPLFFQNNRHKEHTISFGPRDDLSLASLRHCRSDAALNERPRTAGGAASRKFTSPSLQPFMPYTSANTTLVNSQSDSTPARNTIYAEDLGIGVALGSPTEARVPFQFPSLDDASSNTAVPQQSAAEIPSHTTSETVDENPAKPKVTRWRTVSGLFARRKASQAVPSPLSRISEDSTGTPPLPAPRISEEKPRRSLYLKRSRKSRAVSPPPKEAMVTPTPGEARAFEATDPNVGPSLDIAIPNSDFERYSVLFSNLLPVPYNGTNQPRQSLLARRQGKESLTIKSPGLEPKPDTVPFVATTAEPEDSSSQEQTSVEAAPQRQSLARSPSPYRLSALPAPLFSKRYSHLRRSQSAIDLQTVNAPGDPVRPTETETHQPATHPSTPRLAILADSPPDSPATDAGKYSPRWSSASTASTSHFPPSPTSSTYSYYFPTSATYMRSPAPTDLPGASKSPSAAAATEPHARTTTDEAQHYVTMLQPPPTPHSPWTDMASAFPSPLLPSSPSPRLKYGYDAPHSPMLAVARTVTVCVRAGQGKAQRPQFVVQERNARSAVLVG